MSSLARSIWVLTALVALLQVAPAKAAYPDRPVHFVVGFAPGGSADFFTRLLARKLSDKWGQAVLVENRDGAGGAIAEEYVAHAAPDGLTILMVTPNHTVIPSLQKLDYDPIKDFAPVILLGTHGEVLLTNPKYISVQSVKDLIQQAKSNPGKLNFGSTRPASSAFLEMSLLMKMSGISLTPVNYKGGDPAMVALLGGEVQTEFGSVPTALQYVRAGTLRALAVTTDFRDPLMPDVPTVAEAAGLPDYNVGSWNGILVPAGTPAAITQKLHDDLESIMDMADVRDALPKLGIEVKLEDSQAFGARITKEMAQWKGVLSPQQ